MSITECNHVQWNSSLETYNYLSYTALGLTFAMIFGVRQLASDQANWPVRLRLTQAHARPLPPRPCPPPPLHRAGTHTSALGRAASAAHAVGVSPPFGFCCARRHSATRCFLWLRSQKVPMFYAGAGSLKIGFGACDALATAARGAVARGHASTTMSLSLYHNIADVGSKLRGMHTRCHIVGLRQTTLALDEWKQMCDECLDCV